MMKGSMARLVCIIEHENKCGVSDENAMLCSISSGVIFCRVPGRVNQ